MSNLIAPANPQETAAMMQWAIERCPTVEGVTAAALQSCYPIGCVTDNDLTGVWFLHNLRDHMADIGVASSDPSFLTRNSLRAIFGLAFTHLRLKRLNALIARKNKKARDFAERLGFIYEGTLKGALANGQDLCVYRMLHVECKWIGTHNGRPT